MAAPSKLYGLHFMDSNIGMNDLVTAEVVRVGGSNFNNYQMPRDSIDFNLKQKGYINFFAGLYSQEGTANSFFSLHKIERDQNNKSTITSIKEIVKIYANGVAKDEYIYEYKDGTYSAISFNPATGEATIVDRKGQPYQASGYTLEFDLSWIKQHSDFSGKTKALYYYEIPVNAGEFALGSTESTSSTLAVGGYLLYLDIGSSASKTNRTITIEKFTNTSNIYNHPTGVAFIAGTSSTIDNDNSNVAVIIPANFSGSSVINISTTDDLSFLLTSPTNLSASYINPAVTLQQSGAPPPLVPAATEVGNTVTRLTYIDYSNSSGSTTITVITDVTTSGGVTTRSATRSVDGATPEPLNLNTDTLYVVDPTTGLGESTLIKDVKIDTTKIGSTNALKTTTYHTADGTVTLEWTLDTSVDAERLEGTYYIVDGYHVTITASETVTVKVIEKDGQYEIYVNDTLVAVGSEIKIIVP